MSIYRATSEVVACTLTAEESQSTGRAWRKLLRASLIARDEVPGGIRLELHPGSAEALRTLIDIERGCCRWISFELDGATVTMTAAGPGEAALRGMWVVDAAG